MNFFLRELQRNDVQTLNRWRNEPSVISCLGAPFRYVGAEAEEKWFEQYLATRANNVRLAICNDTGALVGAVYLLGIDWVHRSGEFAIWIGDDESRGKGIGEFATRMMLKHAFFDLNLNRLFLSVLAQNDLAIRLYRKVGFVEEGRLRQAVFKNGNYMDLIQMGILAEEYKKELG